MSYTGSVNVSIYSAVDVPSVDLNGKADPYVVVLVGGTRKKTSVKKNCLTPEWKESMNKFIFVFL